mmetsp:Transcript_14725/g.21741  ORF Transcript_14725/g.21741 Transcript_14725/m.21741 type:complete len:333 (-) Transcript_14725:194-1192(-)|eukprot:CAMPEP_0116021098 /NCGR_PEP_ID=MMETSP0321-20121206/10186_1 /TAXON_ID=163516 /ORGANISM="Leptocylindrus danicus var. danicus, Strain B650" /LENGTH=332 /DNA_ID=CAMNT_0003491907 /DNA_START=48 /DNA_END=1046 /DNA_ORIENTATION=+
MGLFEKIAGNALLFFLVFGMSATVDIKSLRSQMQNTKGILTGVICQFLVLPFLGYLVVEALEMEHAMGITLLVVTSSPGGSYSNWWCSLFNADLALSVCMTAISTILSIAMLPINLLIYANMAFEDDVVSLLDWGSLFLALVIVVCAIGLGLLCSAKVDNPTFNMTANKIGNWSGLGLVLFSVLLTGSDEESDMLGRDATFYLGVAAPCLFGILLSVMISTMFQLNKPERVTISIECCYQNVGIATSVALSMFEGDDLNTALGVSLYYGLVEAVFICIFCVICWKMGWSKAPKDEALCTVIGKSYEVEGTAVEYTGIAGEEEAVAAEYHPLT